VCGLRRAFRPKRARAIRSGRGFSWNSFGGAWTQRSVVGDAFEGKVVSGIGPKLSPPDRGSVRPLNIFTIWPDCVFGGQPKRAECGIRNSHVLRGRSPTLERRKQRIWQAPDGWKVFGMLFITRTPQSHVFWPCTMKIYLNLTAVAVHHQQSLATQLGLWKPLYGVPQLPLSP
jgi:hypothetical protein